MSITPLLDKRGAGSSRRLGAGSLGKAEQFAAVDDCTFKVCLVRPDALILPHLAVVAPAIYNSALVTSHVTAADPWGLEFTKSNTPGSGPFKLERRTPGTEVVYARNDDWVCRAAAGAAPHHLVRRQPARADRAAMPTSRSTCRRLTSWSWRPPAR